MKFILYIVACTFQNTGFHLENFVRGESSLKQKEWVVPHATVGVAFKVHCPRFHREKWGR